MKKMNKKGFTIVELSIVIAVIAILSAVLIPTFSGIVKKSKESAAKENAKIAYQQYLFDKAESEADLAEDLIFKTDSKFVVIKDGQILETLYTDEDAAKEALGLEEDNAATPEDEKNYANGPETGITDLTAYTIKDAPAAQPGN